jgi:predicted transcriptional regulator
MNQPISTTAAAELLGVSTRMVRLYIEHGLKTPTGSLKLKAKLVTKRLYLLSRKEVDKFRIMRDNLKR